MVDGSIWKANWGWFIKISENIQPLFIQGIIYLFIVDSNLFIIFRLESNKSTSMDHQKVDSNHYMTFAFKSKMKMIYPMQILEYEHVYNVLHNIIVDIEDRMWA